MAAVTGDDVAGQLMAGGGMTIVLDGNVGPLHAAESNAAVAEVVALNQRLGIVSFTG